MARIALGTLALLGSLVATPTVHAKACTDTSGFAAVMAAVDAAVPCQGIESHRQYVQDAKQAIGSLLDGSCKRQFVARYIKRSLCGRDAGAFEACCGKGKAGGSVVKAGKCSRACSPAPRSVGEGCTDDGTCVTTTTTQTIPTTTTTLLGQPSCGDGIVNQPSEECDGADLGGRSCDCAGGTLACTAACRLDATGCPGLRRFSLDFTNGEPGGVCGEVGDGSDTVLRQLLCGHLYLGGGGGARIPEGATSRFELLCTCSECTIRSVGTMPAANTPGPDCTAPGCSFGTPLPSFNANLPALSTCFVHKWGRPAGGSLDLATGTASLNIPLAADVYLTGANLCPKCSAGGTPASPGNGACLSGARAAQPCTSTNPEGLTRDCLPGANAFLGTIPLNLSPAATGGQTWTSAAGQLCTSQSGCFGIPECRTITVYGSPAGTLEPGTPAAVTLASVFCVPATGNTAMDGAGLPGPGAASLRGTFLLAEQVTSTTTTTSTTAPPPAPPTRLDFTSGTPGGPCGEIRDGAGTVIKTLACGGFNLGNSDSRLSEGLMPAGAISRFALSCVGSSCTVGPDATAPPTNTGGPDCTTTGCRFGAPLPMPNPTLPSIGACVVNTWAGPASGTLDLADGDATLSIPLAADTYLTGIALCPKCSAGGSPASPGTGSCTGGARAGQPCTSTNMDGLTRDCLPATNTFIGGISLNLSPATTATRTLTSATGQFCPGQPHAGCFGNGPCRTITENGAAAGALAPGRPKAATLASTFCIPDTGDGHIDNPPFPGPGAVSLPGTFAVQ